MAIGRVYVGSVGPFLFDDTATYSAEDDVLGGGAVGAVVTDSPISVGSLRLFDTDTSNVLDITWNENDSADRVLNLLVHGADRSLDLYESFKVVDGQDIELHASGGEKAQLAIDTQNAERTLDMSGNLTVEASSIINQDLSSDSATARLANLGVGISADVDMGVYVSKTFSDTDNSGKAALRGVAYVGKVSQNGVTPMTSAGWGVYGQVYLAAANTQNWTHAEAGLRGICGFVGTESGSAGTVTNAANIFALASIHASGGTITNLHGVHICTPTVGGSKVTNEYGVYVCDQNTGATLNYAIYTNAGIVRFGGTLNLATCAAAGVDADKFLVLDATGNVDYRTGANVLADLSGDAGAAFSFNSQNLTSVGTIGCGGITTTGNVLITGAQITQKRGAAHSRIIVEDYSVTPTDAPSIMFLKSAHDTIDTYSTTADGEILGLLSFDGIDTDDDDRVAALLYVIQDGAATGSDVPARFEFRTEKASPAGISSRLTIHSTGNVDIVDHDAATVGLMLGGTLVTASAAEINALDGISADGTSYIQAANYAAMMALLNNTATAAFSFNEQEIKEMNRITARKSAADCRVHIETYSADTAHYSELQLNKSHTNTLGSDVATVDTEMLGNIMFGGVDTAPSLYYAAYIQVNQDGDATATKVPAKMEFWTASAVDRLARVRISPVGNVDIIAHDAATVGLKLGGTLVTKSAAEINAMAPLASPNFTGTPLAPDHGAAATDMLVNVCYGTGAPPAANTTTIGSIYFKYIA